MRDCRKALLLLVVLLVSFSGFAQNAHPVSWKFSSELIGPLTYKVKFQATIKEPYHIYPQLASEGGMGMPTKFLFEDDADIELIGDMEEEGAEKEKAAHYSKGVTFTQTIKLRSEKKTTLAFTIKYMACTNVMCLPPSTKKFTLALRKQSGKKMDAGKNKPSSSSESKQAAPVSYTDFAMADTSGNIISSKEIVSKSKYTYIDFWASWCTPCRAQGRELIPVYEKYKSMGFDVMAVSLDTDPKSWKRAIRADKYTWTNISDLKGFESTLIKKFRITAIPRNFLVDSKGFIVAMDLHGKELEEKLEKLLK